MKRFILLLFIVFSVSANAQIIVNPPVANLVVCDDDNDGFAWFDLSFQTPVITQGEPNLTVTYHGTLVNAQNAVLTLPNLYENDSAYLDFPITDPIDPRYGTGGVWARVESNTSNEINIVPFALEVRFSPVGNVPAPLRVCDDNNDGFAFFDLTTVATEVLGSLNPLGFDLYYYENLADAVMAGDLAITNPDFSQAIPNPTNFLNNTTPQTIYILLVSNANGSIPPNPNSAEGCYDIVELTLQVFPKPNPNYSPTPLELCDDDDDGIVGGWDLTLADVDIIQAEPDVNIRYYETLQNAQNGIPGTEIAGLYTNTVPFNQTVYARVTKSVPPSILPCYAIVPLELIVNEIPPITQPNNLFINEGDGDGFAIFDLTVNIPVMLAGLNPSDYEVSFYVTEIDAQNDTNRLLNTTTFLNTSNPQTIYVRVENVNTGCYVVTSFEILTDETAPDADGDGIANEDEDLNNNGNLNDDDTDGDGIPNYLDSDDDGDSVLTLDETTGIGAGVAPTYIYIDTDSDGIENYLDNDDDGDGTLTIDEDYNNNGTPIDDDTNANGIPDFLDDEVFLSVNSFGFEDLSVYPNPTSESFTVQSLHLVSETTITLYDIQGKLLSSEKMLPQNGTLTIEVSSLENGVYFVKISSEGNTVVKKLLKN
ncbi:T9SS type A sorting domain-containing protein [Aequorivita lipolytica]|uniref:T9SS type A sorting domain-containing protein n=1 Tax=Aequorivita lipolytica TaxID=153267 RepID=A0A5C6YL92_9FLAO|nr:T9SS type A sorting domain-containing protein [Aequorivita lipolytica]TXD68082.1 T9SS type A sorting domain-containing protein [Aequorivita lipolytica]SRX53633.1 hypothetical protein AEQU2_02865 [Aequorivita lipolytica]